MVDNGAQEALAVGVFCTFLGIAFGLLNFNVGGGSKSADVLLKSVDLFISGMQFAFLHQL